MAKLNYGELIGKVVAVEYKEVSYEVVVVDTKMVAKTSKNGRNYKVRRLWVAFKGSKKQLEISTQSWNKRSFMKNLMKLNNVSHLVGTKFFYQYNLLMGDIQALIAWGQNYGSYDEYVRNFDFDLVEKEINDLYDNRDIDGLRELKSKIKAFEIKSEIYDEKEDFVLNDKNVKRYVETTMFTMYAMKYTRVIDEMLSRLTDDLFNCIMNHKSFITYDKYGFSKCDTEREVKKLYRTLSKELHPDCGGDEQQFIAMNNSYNKAMTRFA